MGLGGLVGVEQRVVTLGLGNRKTRRESRLKATPNILTFERDWDLARATNTSTMLKSPDDLILGRDFDRGTNSVVVVWHTGQAFRFCPMPYFSLLLIGEDHLTGHSRIQMPKAMQCIGTRILNREE